MNYPLELRFKLLAIASQISIADAAGRVVLYVKQKAFKLREAITVYSDASQTYALYTIAADRILDISAQYHVQRADGTTVGVIQRRGMRSLWRAHYELHYNGRPVMLIQEENPWVKVMDGFLSELPVIGAFSGYLFHPAYAVRRTGDGEKMLRAVKQPAFFEGKYKLDQVGTVEQELEELAVLGVLTMLLLERARG